MQHPIKQL